ncbi:MAG: CRISPR-associated protein Cas4 [Synergistales bacterium]|nr:CRISPR-associated protein Cas4 [Synergistales bacterium]
MALADALEAKVLPPAVLLCAGLLLWLLFARRERLVELDSRLWRSGGLSGRPDAVTRRGRRYIPHEYKSGAREEPLEGHRVQVLVYCSLLEQAGYPVREGRLHYSGKEFRVPWNRRARKELGDLLREARKVLECGTPPEVYPKGHPRCARCSYAPYCHGAHDWREGIQD